MSQSSAEDLIRKKGCDACRSRKIKCDEKQPVCGKCAKLGRQCSWPMPELRLSLQRRGPGTWRTRDPRWSPPIILNAGALPNNSSTPAESTTHSPDPISQDDDSFHDQGDWSPSMALDNEYTISSVSSDYAADTLQPYMCTAFGGFEPFIPYSSVDAFYNPQSPGPIFSTLSDHHIPASNSIVLKEKDVHALDHYQNAFSIYRTTKVPRWSTHRLLLDLASKNTMIMRFILAVSINDVCYRQGIGSSQEAQTHFRTALRDLVEIVQEDLVENYKYTMAAFLFLYLYIPKQRSIPPHIINQLSITVRDFVKSHRLDSLCLERMSETGTTHSFACPDGSVIARLIIWTYDEDVKCGFQGYGGYLAEYLTAHRERTMAVYEVSRVVLQAHDWGEVYPKAQVDDDDDNAMELELLWALTALWQDINELTQKSFLDYAESCHRIEQRFSLIQKKYSSVFKNSAMTDMPRTRVLMNADYDVVLFNALKIYYFRTTVGDIEMEAPPDIELALESLLTIIRRTFASTGNELHDRLQWPLFLAGIETHNGFYSDWILERMTKNRARAALKTIIQRQSYSGKRLKRLTMYQIRSLLFEGEASDNVPLPGAGAGSFWETLAEF